MERLKLAAFPIIVLVGLVLVLNILNVNLPVFNAPYLKLVLNLVFLTAISIYVAIISAKSYLNFGALNLLVLSNVFLIVGIIFSISSLTAFISLSYAAAIQDIGLLIASGFQVLSAIITILTTSSSEALNRRIALGASYFIVICCIGFFTAEVLYGVAPLFITSVRSTLIGQSVLGINLILFCISWLLVFMAIY